MSNCWVHDEIDGLPFTNEQMYQRTSDYDAIELIYFDPVENAFYDQCGIHIGNIYEYVTPNDIYLFRHNFDHRCFPHVTDKNILVEIVVDDNTCPFDWKESWERWNAHDEDWNKLVKGVYS